MQITYIKSQSSVYPVSPDTSSSKKFVYLRRNVVETQSTDEQTGETHIYYDYEEAKLTKAEYEQYLKELNNTEYSESIETLKVENQALTEQVEMLTACVLEMSELVYA